MNSRTASTEITDDVILARLRLIGDGNARVGFGILCAGAGVCSICCQPRDAAGSCECTP